MREERIRLDRIASRRDTMRDQVEQDHQRNLDLIKFASAQHIESAKLQIQSGQGVRDGLNDNLQADEMNQN